MALISSSVVRSAGVFPSASCTASGHCTSARWLCFLAFEHLGRIVEHVYPRSHLFRWPACRYCHPLDRIPCCLPTNTPVPFRLPSHTLALALSSARMHSTALSVSFFLAVSISPSIQRRIQSMGVHKGRSMSDLDIGVGAGAQQLGGLGRVVLLGRPQQQDVRRVQPRCRNVPPRHQRRLTDMFAQSRCCCFHACCGTDGSCAEGCKAAC